MEKLAYIEKLQGKENYQDWVFSVGLALRGADAYGVVDGTLSPKDPDFPKKNNTAMYHIGSTVSASVIPIIREKPTAVEMWNALKDAFSPVDEYKKAQLNTEFWTFRAEPGENMVTTIARLNNLVADLGRQNESISNATKMTRLLAALPGDYGSFMSAWDSTPDADRTYPKLCQRLVVEEERRGLSVPKPSEALSTRTRQCTCKCKCGTGGSRPEPVPAPRRGGQQQRRARNGQMRCYECNKTGHMRKDCPQRSHSVRKSEALCTFTGATLSSSQWCMDAGSTDHVCPVRRYFSKYQALEEPKVVWTTGGHQLQAEGVGDVPVLAFNGHQWVKKVLKEVLYVPGSQYFLMSMAKTLDQGCKAVADSDGVKFTREGEIVAMGQRKGQLFFMLFREWNDGSSGSCTAVSGVLSLQEWHRRLGHQCKRQVESVLIRCGVRYERGGTEQCEACLVGKSDMQPFPKRKVRATAIGQNVHVDLCGPLEPSLGGSRYFLLVKDEFSHFRFVYCLKTKSEGTQRLMECLAEIERQHNVHVKVLRSDNGGEFTNHRLAEFVSSRGIIHQTTTAYTPQQNGCAEREMRTIMNAVRTMLADAKLPKALWAEAVHTAVYVLNLTGTSDVDNKSPHEVWTGQPPKIDHLQAFGCHVYKQVAKELRTKLNPKAVKCVFVGYGLRKKGVRCYEPVTGTVTTSRNVTFLREDVAPILCSPDEVPSPVKPRVKERNSCDVSLNNVLESRLRPRKLAPPTEKPEVESDEDFEDANDAAVLMTIADEDVSPTYKEAMAGPDADHWRAAMEEEKRSLLENGTWELVKCEGEQRVVDSRWVFRKKFDSAGNVCRYKARLVARGFSQVEGVDYGETFAPVLRYQSFRTMMAVAAAKKMGITFFDVTSAFLNGKLKERVLMKQPQGLEDGTGRVCLLRRSLYGLKQAPRCWNEAFVEVIEQFGLEQSTNDPCVFTNRAKSLVLGIYVDDGVILAEDAALARRLLMHLKKVFQVTSGTDGQFLGMKVTVNEDGSVVLSQQAYARRILRRFGMESSSHVSTPADCNRTNVCSCNSSDWVRFPYREAVGCLNFLATVTRPDIAFAVGVAGRFLQNPGPSEVKLVKRILRYVKGTLGYSLRYVSGEMKMVAYSDADYAGDTETRRSTSGTVVMLAGGPVAWISRRQRIVALSTTEAEYIAGAESSRECVWQRRLIEDMVGEIETPVLWLDNQSALKLIRNPVVHHATKHIDVRYHYIREVVMSEEISVDYVGTEEQKADVLTKALPAPSHRRMVEMLGMIDMN